MAVLKRTLAFLLALIIFASLGEEAVFASPGEDLPSIQEWDGTIPLPEEAPPAESAPETEAPPQADEPAAPPAEEPAAPTEEPSEPTEEPTVPPTEEPIAPPAEQSPAPEAPENTPEPTDEPMVPPEVEEPGTTEEPEATEEPEDLPETAEEPVHKDWPWTEPGNDVAAILNGGRTLYDGSRFYFFENGLWLEQGGARTQLSGANGKNLNLCGQWLYYTENDIVCRMDTYGGGVETVYTAGGSIKQMYVMGDELRMVVSGAVYSYDMGTGLLETLASPADVKGLIPTPYGNLFLTGQLFYYDLWAGQTHLLSNVDSAYPDGDWLVVVTGGETYQTDLAALFSGSVSLQSYWLHQEGAVAASADTSAEAAYLESAEYLAKQQVLREYNNNGIATVSASTVLTKSLTANQQNIVLRAQQMAEVKWKCLKTIYSWGGNDRNYVSQNASWGSKVTATDGTWTLGEFTAGKTYKGVPYSQATQGGYVGWDITLGRFLDATADTQSLFYTSNSTFGRLAPYYGSDCSGFVSYAWDLPYRCTCSTLVNFSELIGAPDKNNLYKLQLGDCLNYTAEHVVLVTDLGYNSSGELVSVEITEQTPSKMRVTVYGEIISGRSYDYTGQLSYLSSYYLNRGYKIYRRKCASRPNVQRPADDAKLSYAPAPTMTVAASGPASAKVTLSHETKDTVIYYTTNGSAPTTSSTKYTGPFTVSKGTNIRAMAVVPGYENSFPLNEQIEMAVAPTLKVAGSGDGSGVFLSNNVYYADPSKKLTLESLDGGTIYYTTDGSNPTLNSSKVTSSTAIEVKDGMTIKAFVAQSGSVPSIVASFAVKSGKLYTITVDDPYGFISPAGSASVLEGGSVTFRIGSANGYTLGNVSVDGVKQGAIKEYTFSNVKADHTIRAEVKLPFDDVQPNSWYVDAVAFCSNKGLFSGLSSNQFGPEDPMNRAMFITVLGRYADPGSTIANWKGTMGQTQGTDIYMRSSTTTSTTANRVTVLAAAGQYVQITGTVPASQSQDGGVWYQITYGGKSGYVRSTMPSSGKVLVTVCPFTDLSGSSVSYCNGYAQWAYLNGIINGIGATSFGSSSNISRQDICVILYNYLTKNLGMRLSGSKSFSDSGSISDYAKTAVGALANMGIITGDEKGCFNPNSSATRAEVAAIFMRLDNYLNK